jgi:fused signal recognition particle receptor
MQPVAGVDPEAARRAGRPRGGAGSGGRAGKKLVSTAHGRHAPHLVLARRERHGPVHQRKLDPAMLEELEDLLVRADLGLEMAARVAAAVGEGRYDREIAPDEVRGILAAEVEKTLVAVARPLTIDRSKTPFVILVIGVNGAGKTTTIGKLAQKFRAQGLKVMMAAATRFGPRRSSSSRCGANAPARPWWRREQGADPAGLAFDALRDAKAAGADVLLIDTAGRLQNRAELMAELEKIVRVMKKLDPETPHAVLLVLDATVGQNALAQVELFRKTAGLTGLVMTKLDGTRAAASWWRWRKNSGCRCISIGVGEGVDDLEPFTARDFARALAGLER